MYKIIINHLPDHRILPESIQAAKSTIDMKGTMELSNNENHVILKGTYDSQTVVMKEVKVKPKDEKVRLNHIFQ
jgi:hypothetical protein